MEGNAPTDIGQVLVTPQEAGRNQQSKIAIRNLFYLKQLEFCRMNDVSIFKHVHELLLIYPENTEKIST